MIEYARGKFFAFVIVLMGFSANTHACSLSFTSPGHGAKVTAAGITVRGTGSGSAQPGDAGTVTALHNGTPFFSQSGTFTAIVSFLESAGAGVQLVPGKNHFGIVHGVKRIVQIEGEPTPNCPASNSSFTYNAQGLLASHTNKLGHTTQYAYNARGLQTLKTEAVGTDVERSTITQWHPALPVPVRREQPGRIQSWTYDTQGRPLSHSITSE